MLKMDERRRLLPRDDVTLSPVRRGNGACGRNIACAAILTSVALERLAFYALTGNLVLFLNKSPFTWESYHAMNASFYFLGMSFVTSLFGGWLADSVFGRFKAVLISLVIYIGGFVFMPLLSPKNDQSSSVLPYVCRVHINNNTVIHNGTGDGYSILDDSSDMDRDPFDEKCAWLIYIVLTIVAVGNGSFKANIAPFGADQVTSEGSQATLGFFNWYYWSVNIGAFIGLFAITWVEQQVNFFDGYLSACVCLSVGGLVFLMGGCCYTRRPPSGSVLTNIFRIIREAFRMRHRRKKEYRTKSFISGRMIDEAEPVQEKLTFLDYAKHRHGGIFHDSLVEDVKELKKVIIVFATLIPYWLVYFQMQTTFLVQGLHMKMMWSNVNMTSNGDKDSPQIVAAWFSLFDVVFLILLLPLFDRFIYPRLEKAGYPFGMTKRIALGMVFSTAAMIVAGVVEYFRLQAFWPYPDDHCKNKTIEQYIGSTNFSAADMSIWWQIPQYSLIGLSEIFTSVAGLQFAYSMAPKSMKGIIMGLFYLFCGIGSFLGTAIISILYSQGLWFLSKDFGNINCRLPCTAKNPHVVSSCHLDYYFYLLAGIEVLGLILFIIVASVLKLGAETPPQRSRSHDKRNEPSMIDAKHSSVSIQRQTSDLSS